MKLVMGFIIVCCSGLVGIELYLNQRRRCDLIAMMQSLCLHMTACVRYQRTEPDMIIFSFTQDKYSVIEECSKSLNDGKSFFDAWRGVTENKIVKSLSIDEKSVISEMGLNFGKNDSEGEIARLQYIYERLGGMYSKRSEICEQQGKMYIVSGFLVGVLIMIFVI